LLQHKWEEILQSLNVGESDWNGEFSF
jgi:hypothetical protein